MGSLPAVLTNDLGYKYLKENGHKILRTSNVKNAV
jgi:hypothetical protein